MNDLAAIDLSKVLDRPKLSGFQVLILCLCALVIVLVDLMRRRWDMSPRL